LARVKSKALRAFDVENRKADKEPSIILEKYSLKFSQTKKNKMNATKIKSPKVDSSKLNSNKMKAIVCTKYGSPDVLQLQEVEKPIPKDNEVLIKVFAASVTAADGMMRKGSPYIGRLFIGLRKPKNPIPGTGFAGVIEAIGKDVKLFNKGDSVFGESIFGHGTNAEYTCVPEEGIIALKPNNLTYEEAAPVCDGALTSLNFLKNLAKIERRQKVLINGASGSLGTAAVQLAKYFGAEVTGVCSSTNIEMVESLGADSVIDYTKTDFTETGQTYDIIYNTVGKSSYSKCKDSLTKKGVYLSPVLSLPLLFQVIKTSIFGGKKAMFDATGIRPVPELRMLLNELKKLIEAGQLKSIIDRSYSLENIAEAHSFVDKGHKKGNVVITLNHDN
jgi:NADPH:quinone reductase-like Zn-dependent oxidoreductase